MSISWMRGELLAIRAWWPRYPPVPALNARFSVASSSLAPSGGKVMNTDEKEVSLKAWRQLYEAAVLGLDPTKIQDRIEEAEKAIAKRAIAVMREGGDDRAEREALANAMQGPE